MQFIIKKEDPPSLLFGTNLRQRCGRAKSQDAYDSISIVRLHCVFTVIITLNGNFSNRRN